MYFTSARLFLAQLKHKLGTHSRVVDAFFNVTTVYVFKQMSKGEKQVVYFTEGC